ncbi:MAG: ubiquinone biosynthesis regulatory protein kinase UbiB [Cardiobacteriaceae bacterium]|nr:ubiquinone biosynthesis regulatory protein kinase UbiB [Cardiobacteriaceae bacterium]
MFSSFKRIYSIFHSLIYYRLDEYLPKKGYLGLVSYLSYLHPTHYRRCDIKLSRGERLRQALEELGPIFVKLGQTLSTRPDLIPTDIIEELNKLQDRVPAFSTDIAKQIIESELGKKIEAVFAEFEEKSLASASVAQVHGAVLQTGEKVVVKVLRPEVGKKVAQDVALMYWLARLLSSTNLGRRLRSVEVVREFEYTMEKELDLTNEAAAASNVRANFADSELLYVPEIYWGLCTAKVMVQERVFFVNISDVEAMEKAKVNKKVLAERGVEIFFTQVFRDSFFHADMHPGNIFVDISDPEKPKYCAIDFGIMGSLTPQDQHYLAENFLAFFNRDYRRVAELHIESGWIPANTRITDFEAAIRRVSEPIFGKPIKDISFGAFLFSLFQTARRFNMQIQPQLVLLQKTFFNVEGLGRRLYPDLDLWTSAKPVLENWLKSQISPKAALGQIRKHSLEYTDIFPQLPLLMHQYLSEEIQRNKNRKTVVKDSANTVAGAILISSAVGFWLLASVSWLQIVVLLVCAMLGIWLILKK